MIARMFRSAFNLYYGNVNCLISVMEPCLPGHYITHSGSCEMCLDGTYQTDGYHSNCVQCGHDAIYSTGGPGASYYELCGNE